MREHYTLISFFVLFLERLTIITVANSFVAPTVRFVLTCLKAGSFFLFLY